MELAVIGAGKWGEALHRAFLQKDKSVAITSRTVRNLPNFVPLKEALKAKRLVISVPTQAVRLWLEKEFVYEGQEVLVVSKGIEVEAGEFLNEIYSHFVPEDKLAFLSGPGFASEVIKSLPTALTIASLNERCTRGFMAVFPSWIKTYSTFDVIGAEIAGAYKNVIAIAAGASDAMGLGNNARAALITRGLAEMTRFGVHFGAKEQTFLGLAGVGDLMLTATSTLSRNYRVGKGLGEGKGLDEILVALGEVAEGVPTAKAIVMLSEQSNLYTPIAKEVALLLDGKDPRLSVEALLSRGKEEEF